MRQEGFTRLADRLAEVPATADPVHDMPADALATHVPALTAALFLAAGDDPHRRQESIRRGWTLA